MTPVAVPTPPGGTPPAATPGAPPPAVAPPPAAGADGLSDIMTCFSGPREEHSTCADEFVSGYVMTNGYSTMDLLAEMESTRAVDEAFDASCHPVAHAIGRHTISAAGGSVPEAFSNCNDGCLNGCYHGVMERVFVPEGSASDHPTLENIQAKMPDVCASDQFDSQAVLFQCLHGLGHGVMYTLAYNLSTAIETCSLVDTEWSKSACRSGVFMENVYPVDPALRDLDPESIHYPCDQYGETIAADCYGMQTSAWVDFGLDDKEIVTECETAGDPTIGVAMHQCFISIGRHSSQLGRAGKHEELRHICEDLTTSTTNANSCVSGAVASLADAETDGNLALAFCNTVKGDALAQHCFTTTRNRIAGLFGSTQDAWNATCQRLSPDRVEMCSF